MEGIVADMRFGGKLRGRWVYGNCSVTLVKVDTGTVQWESGEVWVSTGKVVAMEFSGGDGVGGRSFDADSMAWKG